MAQLTEARAKAAALLAELERKQADLAAAAPDLDPQAIEQGKLAMRKAVEAAQRTVGSIDAALRLASTSSN